MKMFDCATKKLCKDGETAKAHLVKIGTHDKHGNITKEYGGTTFDKMIEAKSKPDYIDVQEQIKCRYFDIVLSKSLTDKHFDLMSEFIRRHIKSPRGGCSGPWDKDASYNHLQFFLNEAVADEYLRRMNETNNAKE